VTHGQVVFGASVALLGSVGREGRLHVFLRLSGWAIRQGRWRGWGRGTSIRPPVRYTRRRGRVAPWAPKSGGRSHSRGRRTFSPCSVSPGAGEQALSPHRAVLWSCYGALVPESLAPMRPSHAMRYPHWHRARVGREFAGSVLRSWVVGVCKVPLRYNWAAPAPCFVPSDTAVRCRRSWGVCIRGGEGTTATLWGADVGGVRAAVHRGLVLGAAVALGCPSSGPYPAAQGPKQRSAL